MFPSSGAALDEPVAMIDHEGDDDNDVQLQQDGADEEEAAGVVRPQMSEKPCTTSSTSASANRSNSTDELPSLGAIFQTAYTSNSQSSNPSQNAARTGGGSNSENSSSSVKGVKRNLWDMLLSTICLKSLLLEENLVASSSFSTSCVWGS